MDYLYTLCLVIGTTTQIKIVLLIYKFGYNKPLILFEILNTILVSWSIYQLIK